MHSISVRPAEPLDLPTILDFLCLKADFDGCADALKATPSMLHESLFGDTPLAFVLLADLDETPAGFASYYPIYSTFLGRPGLWLDDLYVKPAYRQMGIGKALIQHLCAVCESLGGGRIDWIVNRANANAIQFYTHMGAQIRYQNPICRLDQEAIARHCSSRQPI